MFMCCWVYDSALDSRVGAAHTQAQRRRSAQDPYFIRYSVVNVQTATMWHFYRHFLLCPLITSLFLLLLLLLLTLLLSYHIFPVSICAIIRIICLLYPIRINQHTVWSTTIQLVISTVQSNSSNHWCVVLFWRHFYALYIRWYTYYIHILMVKVTLFHNTTIVLCNQKSIKLRKLRDVVLIQAVTGK